MTGKKNKAGELTTSQRQVLAYLRTFFQLNHCLPPNATISGAFGWASPNAASEVMLRLARAGMLELNEIGRYRFTQAGLGGVVIAMNGSAPC